MFRIQLDGKEPNVIHVTGHAVESALQLLGVESDTPLICVKFGATYFGSDVTQSAVLYNNGPEAVKFVIILNDCAEGQIMVISVFSLYLIDFHETAFQAFIVSVGKPKVKFLIAIKNCCLLALVMCIIV
jgi:hypothetical protein